MTHPSAATLLNLQRAETKRLKQRLATLTRENARLREALQIICYELENRYDGAPDSITKWMSSFIVQAQAALKETP